MVGRNRNTLTMACTNKGVDLAVVQLILDKWPETIWLGYAGYRPIHPICMNDDLEEVPSIDILQFMLKIDPSLLRERDRDGYLPIHHAVCKKSFAVCKLLINDTQSHWGFNREAVCQSIGAGPWNYLCSRWGWILAHSQSSSRKKFGIDWLITEAWSQDCINADYWYNCSIAIAHCL